MAMSLTRQSKQRTKFSPSFNASLLVQAGWSLTARVVMVQCAKSISVSHAILSPSYFSKVNRAWLWFQSLKSLDSIVPSSVRHVLMQERKPLDRSVSV